MSIYKTTKRLTFAHVPSPDFPEEVEGSTKVIAVTSNSHQEILGYIRFADRLNEYCFLMSGNNSILSKTDMKETYEVIDELNKEIKK
jgi:hypothetical protein